MPIHPTAVIHPGAELDSGVEVGPYSQIGPHVRIGRDTVIDAQVIIEGHTRVGARNRLFPFAFLGGPPQDIGYRGEETRLTIGDDNIIREYVTIHRATTKENRETVVGDRNYLMGYSHVAHDCRLADGIVIANGVQLGGHVRVGEGAGIGGLTAIHQFVRIGAYSFIGGLSGVSQDVPPYMMVAGEHARLFGLNQKGLTRAGFSAEAIKHLKEAYRMIWRQNRRLREAIPAVREHVPASPELEVLLSFLENAKRGVLR